MSTKDDIAAFLAKGGKVTEVPAGVGNEHKIGLNPSRNREDIVAQRAHEKSEFALAGADQQRKPKRYGGR